MMGAMMRSGQAMSPDHAKKLQSGFWKHEYRAETGETIWRCDLHKLNETIRDILMDYHECKRFQSSPADYLDTRFGSDTARVYFSKRNDKMGRYINIRENPYLRENMAYWNTGTTTNTNTTTSTSGSLYMYDELRYMQEKMIREQAHIPPVKKKTPAPKKRLVRNMPFVNGGDSLLATLQRDFDHWAGAQMKVIHA